MVEWKPLNKIVKSITTGLNPRKNFILNEEGANLYYVTVKEITTNKVVFSESTDRITEKAKLVINNRSKLKEGDILFSGIGTIGKVAYVDTPTNNWDCSESVFLIKPNEMEIKGKYLAYILVSDVVKRQYEKGSAGAIMKGVRKTTLESLQIPIPSLSEQNRLVGILDTFTASIENLKEQITQRRKQFEYYRNKLLDLEGKEGVEMMKIGKIIHVRKGEYITKKEANEGIYPVILGGKEPAYYIDRYNHSGKAIVISRSGASAGYVSYWNEPIFVTDGFLIEPKEKVGFEYLYYVLKYKQRELQNAKKGGAIPHITPSLIESLDTFLPDLSTQSRIVSILDTFKASISNLEAQLSQREKQYNYYRNKLLTFE